LTINPLPQVIGESNVLQQILSATSVAGRNPYI
jgi:hypothetical protein